MKHCIMLAIGVILANMAHATSNGVSVACTIPESLVTLYEFELPITITVSNGTENAIPFLRDKFAAYAKQIWVDLGNKEQFIHPRGFGLRPEKQWDNTVVLNKWKAESRLNPRESASWTLDFRHIVEILDYASDRGTSNITIRVQLGNNQWASSETLPLYVVPRSLDHPENEEYWNQYKVAEFESAETTEKKPKKASFFVIPVKGMRTLFDQDSQEICVLGDDQTPKIERDGEEVSISFSSAKGEQRIRYDLQQMDIKGNPQKKLLRTKN